jgi:hypothetical protein
MRPMTTKAIEGWPYTASCPDELAGALRWTAWTGFLDGVQYRLPWQELLSCELQYMTVPVSAV